MCKKCTKLYHTLLLRYANYLSQTKPKNEEGKEGTHVAALSVSKQVLLMTCTVKVTTPCVSSIKARTLIDKGSSASFIHE